MSSASTPSARRPAVRYLVVLAQEIQVKVALLPHARGELDVLDDGQQRRARRLPLQQLRQHGGATVGVGSGDGARRVQLLVEGLGRVDHFGLLDQG